MADFCKQCSEELFGMKDRNDMSGRITEEQLWDRHMRGLRGW